jgi:GntR family transcriptional regulator/MocR family aminotransferase
MLTYELKKSPGVPLYEALYRAIRGDILTGKLAAGEKLPSKRALAENLEVSKITVETAYNQLLAEGYIVSREKIGYFVEDIPHRHTASPVKPVPKETPAPALVDLTANGSGRFPFSAWSRLQREIMLDYGEKLLLPMPNRGIPELRQAIADHLAAFRGMKADPENILIGAGTDFLYNILVQLLGRDKVYALEEPGYDKTRHIYTAAGARCVSAPMDEMGVKPEGLTEAGVLHISPSHHFPTGIVTPVSRRLELLDWAAEERWIIEDDYDSEFRFHAHPMPTMQALDRAGRVVYLNTFSKSLAPSIRISYMVLPEKLMEKFRRELSFYSCTVPSFEQYTLARFIAGGWFEKHINRMRKYYKTCRNRLIGRLENGVYAPRLTIQEKDAGLHFLVKVDTEMSEEELVAWCGQRGVKVRTLSSYYHGPVPDQDKNCLVVNYSGLREEDLDRILPPG